MVLEDFIPAFLYYVVLPLIIVTIILSRSKKKTYLAGIRILIVTMIALTILALFFGYELRHTISAISYYLVGWGFMIIVPGVPIAFVTNLILLALIVFLLKNGKKKKFK